MLQACLVPNRIGGTLAVFYGVMRRFHDHVLGNVGKSRRFQRNHVCRQGDRSPPLQVMVDGCLLAFIPSPTSGGHEIPGICRPLKPLRSYSDNLTGATCLRASRAAHYRRARLLYQPWGMLFEEPIMSPTSQEVGHPSVEAHRFICDRASARPTFN